MSRAVYQAGLSWALIDRQWGGFLEAFEGFEPTIVAAYGDVDVARILAHPGIVHSERKTRATIRNARTILSLHKEHGGFARYLRSRCAYADLRDDLQRRFAYVGDISVYYFLYRVGEPVPPYERWARTVKGHHPRIREMLKTGARPKRRLRV
ncbi:MAG: DNA-3-methyladenine glycosylase I [Candidatus Eremiobacteraeota bacterium]|nr:DNA-3-methyladenine glycosylase I [Candidatus Eremiobacteraeota bacterium]